MIIKADTTRISLVIDNKTLKHLDERAKEQNKKRSEVIREAIWYFCMTQE